MSISKGKHPGGRPTKYDPSFCDKVDDYLKTATRENMHLPKLQSFAIYLNVSMDALEDWRKLYPEFSGALDKIMKAQAERLIDDGIYGGKEVNSTIVKLLLQNNHGMKERSETEISGPDKEPVRIVAYSDADALQLQTERAKRAGALSSSTPIEISSPQLAQESPKNNISN